MSHDIILIGPISAGKTTIAALLGEKLQRPVVSLDVLRWDYYNEIGYDPDEARRRNEADGFWAMYEYWKPFELHAVERVLSSHSDCIIEFGAGHSVYEDPTLFARAQAALAPYKHVILLLPSPDVDESYRVLCARDVEAGDDPDPKGINRHFLEHPSNASLATHTVYTAGKTPDDVTAELLAHLGS